MNKKIIYILSIILGVLFICNTSFATDYGIMPTSVIEDSNTETDENGNVITTIDYKYNGTTKVYTGSITLPTVCYDGTYSSYALFINNDGTPVLFANKNIDASNFIFCQASNLKYKSFIFTNNSNSVCYSYDIYIYSSGTWTLKITNDPCGLCRYSAGYEYLTNLFIGGYLHSKNLSVYSSYSSDFNYGSSFLYFRSNGQNYKTSDAVLNGSLPYYDIHSYMFFGTSPYLIELSDTTYKVALGTCYDGYTFTSTSLDLVNVTATKINSLFIYIYDLTEDNGNYFWSTSYSALHDYIYYDENYGMVLELPFNTAFGESFFEKGHDYKFQFRTSVINTVEKYGYEYNYCDEADFSSELISYGSGNVAGGGGTEEDDSTDDKYNELQNTIIESNNQLNNTIADQTNAINNQTDAIKEQNETSKGIWDTIKDILSYLNPFSENFFAYKLLDLLYEGLKALFIPSDDFLSNWFTDVNDYFADQFGILYYPVDVVISFLDTLDVALVDTEPILNIPAFRLSFMGYSAELLPATTYNFNTLLENETFAKVHTFYIFFVNVIFTIGLLAFASKIFTEIFGGIDDSVDHAIYNSQADARAYNQVRRQSEARKAYQRNTTRGGQNK